MKRYGVSVVRADGSYGYATITYSEAPTVTIDITSINSSDNKWRVRGRASLGDNEIYLSEKGLGTYTFDSDDNKSYIFQIQNWNGDWVNTSNMSEISEDSIFNVEFESDGSGDDDGGGGSSGDEDYSSTPRTLHINCGVGIEKISLHRSWPDYRPCYDSLDDGAAVYYDGEDTFYISYVRALNGYDVDYYTFNGKQIPCKLQNFAFSKTSGGIDYYKLASDADATISATATPKSYKLTASAGPGVDVIVDRLRSNKSGAPLGVLSNGATIYYDDLLRISTGVDMGYDITDISITGCIETEDGDFIVVGNTNVSVTSGSTGFVYIDNGTSFVPCLVYIDNGVNWQQYMPYVDNGISWIQCS